MLKADKYANFLNVWLVYSDWILPLRKPLYYLCNGRMSKILEFLLIFFSVKGFIVSFDAWGRASEWLKERVLVWGGGSGRSQT